MILRRTMLGVAVVAVAGWAGQAAAQPRLPKLPRAGEPRQLGPQSEGRRGRGGDDVPPAYRPPPGMCRIWLENVAPAQQPAPTDCGSAVRNRPANARVLFGDDYARDGADAGRPLDRGTELALLTGAPGARWAVGLGRAHGPMADDAGDSVQPPAQRPAARVPARPPAATDDDDEARDDWSAGYAAGYRDAMNGRRPRVRGAERRPRTGAEGGAGVGAVVGGDDPLVVVPSGAVEADPRYFNSGRVPPPGRANGVCLDRDADGWCDDPRFGAPVCRDLDGDGRCDDVPALAAAPFPAALPEMRAGTDVQRGQGSQTALRWLGTTEVVARASGGRPGAPGRVVWLDANSGALLQVWTDRDGDGVADRVEVFRNGRRVKLLGR